jgi:hypothetical protein
MKRKYLVGLVLALLLASLARADGIDHFVSQSASPGSFPEYQWDWPSIAADSPGQFSIPDPLCYGPPTFDKLVPCNPIVYDVGLANTACSPLITGDCKHGLGSSVSVLCVAEPWQCDVESEYFENNAAPVVDKHGRWIPGVYLPAPGLADPWDEELKIPRLETPEPPTGTLLLSGAVVGLLLLRRFHS